MTFGERFFGEGNLLRWEAVRAGTLPPDTQQRLGPFLEDLRRGADPLVLPRPRDSTRVQWYVLCGSSRVARTARDELRAFLGPSYSDFEGDPPLLDPADSVEAAVLERYNGNAFRLEIPDPALFAAARARLLLMLRLGAERPPRHTRRVRPTGRVLRDFEYTLLTRDGDAASECLAELREAGALDATNLLFLEVRRLAALTRWDELLKHPDLDGLLEMQRPRRVTEAVIFGVYFVLVAPAEQAGNHPARLVEHFRAQVLPRFASLYRSRAGLQGQVVDLNFLLFALASEPPRLELAKAIVESYPLHSSARTYLEAFLPPALAIAPVIPDLLTAAREALALAEVDRAFEIAANLPPSPQRTAVLILCAREMGTLEAAQVAFGAVQTLPSLEQARLRQNLVLARAFDQLSLLVSTPPLSASVTPQPVDTLPSSWSSWLSRLQRSEPWPTAVAVAEAAVREWSRDALTINPMELQTVADLLWADRPTWAREVLRDALPYLLDFFVSTGIDARLRPIYDALFLVVATDDMVSVPQFAALLQLADARLTLGLTKAEYGDAVRELQLAAQALDSPAATAVVLEALDTLVELPCQDVELRGQFLLTAVSILHRWSRRVDASQWILVRTLGADIGFPDLGIPRPEEEPEADVESPWSRLRRQKVALYSLRESALRRAEAVLSKLCPDVSLQLFHDKTGGSPSLRAAAETADVFVICTAAAKHSATDFIEAHRPRSRSTLYARSQGTAGIVDALRVHLTHITER